MPLPTSTRTSRELIEQGLRLAAELHTLVDQYPTDGPGPAIQVTVSFDGSVELDRVKLQPSHVQWLTDLLHAEMATVADAHCDGSGRCGHCGGLGRTR